MSTAQGSRYFKIGEAAKLLGLSSETLRRWERAGKITFSRTPGGKRLFSNTDLEAIRNLLKPTHVPQKLPLHVEIEATEHKEDKPSKKGVSSQKRFSPIRKPSLQFFALIKTFALILLIIGNIAFFSQTPYPKVLSEKLKVSSEIISKKTQPYITVINKTVGEQYKKISQNFNFVKEKSIEQTSKVVVKAKKVILAEEIAPAMDYIYASTPLFSPTNLIINSSFEAGIGNYSIIGQSTNTNTKVVNESIRTGTLALKMRDDFCIGCHLGVSQPKVNTINGRGYAFSMYIRVKDLVGSPTLRIGLFGEVSKSDPLYLSQPANYSYYSQDRYEDHYLGGLRNDEWVRISSSFDNLPLGKYPIILIYDYQGGTVYIDDLSLNEGVSEGDLVLAAYTGFNFPIEENNIKLGSNTITTDAFGNITTPGKITAGEINLTGTLTNSGHGIFSSLTVTGNINSDDGALQTNGVTRIDNSGNLTAGTGSFSGNVTPGLDATYNFGSESVRWLNGYFSGDVVVGDAVFKNDFRLTEGLRAGKHSIDMLNPRGEMIASFDEDGNFWVKGEIRQWKKN